MVLETDIESTKLMQSHFSLGGGDSDADEGVDDEDNLEMTKYDEGEVAVNEEDELAVGSFNYAKEKVVASRKGLFNFSRSTMPRKE